MKNAATGPAERAVNNLAQLGVAAQSDVLQHADGSEGIETARNVAVIVFDEFYTFVQTLFASLLPRVNDLFVRQIEGLHARAVLPGHVQRERAPAATGLDNCLTR